MQQKRIKLGKGKKNTKKESQDTKRTKKNKES